MVNVFQRDGECWTVVFAGNRCHLRDARGLRILAVLLGRPGESLSASELLAATAGGRRTSRPGDRERDRVRATRAIREAVRKLGRQSPALREHLGIAVRTGYSCVYLPRSGTDLGWRITPSVP